MPYGEIIQAVGRIQDVGRNTDGLSILLTMKPEWIAHHQPFNKPNVIWPLRILSDTVREGPSTSRAQIAQESGLPASPTTPQTRSKAVTQLPTPVSTPRKYKRDFAEDSKTREHRERKHVRVAAPSPPVADGSPRRRSPRGNKTHNGR